MDEADSEKCMRIRELEDDQQASYDRMVKKVRRAISMF